VCEKENQTNGGGAVASEEEKPSALGKTKPGPAAPAGEESKARTLAPERKTPMAARTRLGRTETGPAAAQTLALADEARTHGGAFREHAL
jgi:hypothetical protein